MYHTIESLNEEYTVLKNKIIVAFHIYSNFDHHFILSRSILLGLNFGAFYFFGLKFRAILFFWVVEICSWTSIPVKEMPVYPPGLGGKVELKFSILNGSDYNTYLTEISITTSEHNQEATLYPQVSASALLSQWPSQVHLLGSTSPENQSLLQFLSVCKSF